MLADSYVKLIWNGVEVVYRPLSVYHSDLTDLICDIDSTSSSKRKK
jgi:hypothetical protein